MQNRIRLAATLLISLTAIAFVWLLFGGSVTGGYAAPESPTQELDVTKRANADYVQAGDQLTYTLAVTNTGGEALTATIRDILPPEVTYGGTIILPPRTLIWSPVLLAPGEVWTETVVVTVTPGYAGPLTNTLLVTTEEGAWGTDTAIVIAQEGIAGLAAFNNSPTWLGSTTRLTATVATGSNVTFVWDFGDGGTGSGALVSHMYQDVGTYTAVVTAGNDFHVMTATTVVTITDVPITRLIATNDSPTAFGSPTMLIANVSTGSSVTYTWAFGDGTFGSGKAIAHTYLACGTYTAIVTASNSTNFLSTSTQVRVVAYVYLPLVLRTWSAGSVVPTPTPTITPTPSPQDVYVLPNDSYYRPAGGPLYIVGEAQNDGDTYAVNVDIPVELLDGSGKSLGSYKVLTSLDLPAGGKTCFHLVINNPPATWASIEFGAPTYLSFANRPWLDLAIYGDSGAHETDNTYRIVGSVRNDESTLVSGVLIEGALYDADGKIVGCHLVPAINANLSPGHTSSFELFYGYDGDYSGVTSYRVQADGLLK